MIDIYYTPVPPHFESDQRKVEVAPQLISYHGVAMYVRPHDQSHFEIVDLCTTNPAYYLQPDFAPGRLIPSLLHLDTNA